MTWYKNDMHIIVVVNGCQCFCCNWENKELVDFKVEFGKNSKGEILLADEITPDTCRFWDKETGKKLDKDRFRRDLGSIEEAYIEVLNRLNNL